MPDPPKTSEYFQGWYDENRDDLNERRRRRYAEDPEYRAKVQKWNRDARDRRRKAISVEERAMKKAMKLRASGAWKTVEIEVDGVKVRMFSIGALARALGKGISTIRVWERTGVLPETPHRSERGDRLYTLEMVEAARNALYKAGKLDGEVLKAKKRPPFVDREVVFGSGDVLMLRLYKVGTLAAAVDRRVVALAQMERRGVLPRTPLVASSLKYRLYTLDMIEVVQKAFQKRGGDIRGQSEWEDFHDEIAEGWTGLGIMDAKVRT